MVPWLCESSFKRWTLKNPGFLWIHNWKRGDAPGVSVSGVLWMCRRHRLRSGHAIVAVYALVLHF